MAAPVFGVNPPIGDHHCNVHLARPRFLSEVCLGPGGSPDVIARQHDVLPAERSDMGQQVIRNSDILRLKLPHRAVEIDSVPVHSLRCHVLSRRTSAIGLNVQFWTDRVAPPEGYQASQ